MTRSEFEQWIAEDLSRIAAASDRALQTAGVSPSEITRVFMTGGTALVPAVRNIFALKFGAEKIVGGDEFSSVAQGLALMGFVERRRDNGVRQLKADRGAERQRGVSSVLSSL